MCSLKRSLKPTARDSLSSTNTRSFHYSHFTPSHTPPHPPTSSFSSFNATGALSAMISVIFRATPKNIKGSLLRPRFRNIANHTSTTSSSTASRSLRPTAYPYRAYSSTVTSHTRRTMASAPSTASTSATTTTLPTPASSSHSISPPSSVKSSNPSTVLTTANHRPVIDTAAIDAQMKLASLNHLAGYATTSYPDAVPQSSTTKYTPEEMARGYEVLREPFFNKGAFYLTLTSLQVQY